MRKLHPLAALILGPLGLGLVACDDGAADGSSCVDQPPRTNDYWGCTLEVPCGKIIQAACIDMEPDAAGACPAAGEPVVTDRAADLWGHVMTDVTDACGPLDASRSAEAEPIGEVVAGEIECCYAFVATRVEEGGRPFLVAGEARVASAVARNDWTVDATAGEALGPAERQVLAAAWQRDAAYEHASVASFARFTLELLAVGAPPDLVAGSQQAGLEEIRHAQLCFGLAARYGGAAVGPGPLELGDVQLASSLREVVAATVREGCVGETIAALMASRALAAATEPVVREVLSIIAEDEARHAALAWKVVAWAVKHGGEPIRQAAREALTHLQLELGDGAAEVGVDAVVLMAHGKLDAAQRRAVAVEAMREVIGPCAARILGAGTPRERLVGEAIA